MKTICALATARMNCAIHIIRISGPDCFPIINKIINKPIDKMGYKIWHRNIIDNSSIIDNVLINSFVAPKSYTGEDLIEINCHGGVYLADRIINLLTKHGCILAKPGEFSQRSLLNKKIDVFQVEAINNLIYAQNDIAINGSINALEGSLKNLLTPIKESLLMILGQIEVNIDYPEFDDVPIVSVDEALNILKKLSLKISNLIHDSKKYIPLSSGIKIGIIGAPNSGKSSLLNLLSNEEKAIVSDISGTTRDIVESSININGLLLKIYDTAGIRDTNDDIEKIGIKKAIELIQKVDVIIYLIDASKPNIDKTLIELLKDKNYMLVYNKIDLINDISKFKNELSISVKNKDVTSLFSSLKNIFEADKFINSSDLCVLQSNRQICELENINYLINNAINTLESTRLLDLICSDLENAYQSLSKLLGLSNNYDFLDDLFKNFCIGK